MIQETLTLMMHLSTFAAILRAMWSVGFRQMVWKISCPSVFIPRIPVNVLQKPKNCHIVGIWYESDVNDVAVGSPAPQPRQAACEALNKTWVNVDRMPLDQKMRAIEAIASPKIVENQVEKTWEPLMHLKEMYFTETSLSIGFWVWRVSCRFVSKCH